MLTEFFGITAEVISFIGQWVQLPVEHQTCQSQTRTKRHSQPNCRRLMLHCDTALVSQIVWITALGLCCSPAILTVCVIVLTGDVSYNQADASGNLKKWGYAN